MWPHRSITDDREPLFTFGEYAFYNVSTIYWLGLLSIISILSIVAATVGLLLWAVVVKPKAYESNFSYLLVYGVLLPFWINLPVVIIRFCGIRNLLFRFIAAVIIPILCLFRTTEVCHGFTPEYATKSRKDFCIYYASVLVFSRDEKGNYVPCPGHKVQKHFLEFIGYLVILGSFQSMLEPHKNLSPFGAPISTLDEWLALERFKTWDLYANNMGYAVLFQIYLTTYCQGLTFFWTALFGWEVDEVMRNPMFLSKSPSDFWSRRWNLLIHRVLKGGVYKPIRKHFKSAALASIAAFMASGAFHESQLYTIFTPIPDQLDESGICPDCYQQTYGLAMIFFVWQAVLILTEIVFGKSRVFQTLGRALPTPIRTMLIIGSSLPLAHLFCEPYFRSDFFRYGSLALPMVKKTGLI